MQYRRFYLEVYFLGSFCPEHICVGVCIFVELVPMVIYIISPDMMQDCKEGEDYCVDEMLVDWLPKGDQVFFSNFRWNWRKKAA